MKASVFLLICWQCSWALGVAIDKCCRKPNIHTLDCSGCRLEQVPSLSDPEMFELNLKDNLIRNIPDFAFANLTSLQSLNLRGNPLASVRNHGFQGLGRLQKLDLTQKDPYNIAELSFKPLFSLKIMKFGNVCGDGNCQQLYIAVQHFPKTLEFLELSVPKTIEFNRFPSLPNLNSLVLFGHSCSLPKITQETFEAFAGSLNTLEIHDCEVAIIDTKFLRNFYKLKTLNFACNRDANITRVFESVKQMPQSTLQTLIADGVHKSDFISLKTNWVNSVRFENVQRLSLRSTNIIQVYLDVCLYLPSLTHFNLGFNSIISSKQNVNQTVLLSFLYQHNITAIDVTSFGQPVSASNIFREKFCRDADIYSDDFFRKPPRDIVIPNPLPQYNHTIDVNENDKPEENLAKNIPPSILFFYGSSLGFSKGTIKDTSFTPDNNVLFLDFSYTPVKEIRGQLHGLNQLQGIDLSGCGILHINPSFAELMPSLKFWNLSHNELSHPMFTNISQLQTLDLSFNRIQYLSVTVFENIESLATLMLHSNSLGALEINLRHNINLSLLDLRNSSLIVTETLMEDLEVLYTERKELLEVKIGDNIFQCDCSTLNFLQWLKRTKVNLSGRSNFHCYDKKGQLRLISEIDVDALNYTCNKMHIVTIAVTPLASLIVVLLLLTLVHRYRWQLKWRFYLVCRSMRFFRMRHREGAQMLLEEEDMCYKAFISYNHADDYEWVCETLLPKVEDEWGFNMCVGQRDFIAGMPIAENICKSIDKSQFTILVITPGFVSSEWCEFEMHMALVKGMSHIIVIYKEEVDVDQMSRTLRGLMSSVNYIEYSDAPDGKDLFWKRLQDTLLINSN